MDFEGKTALVTGGASGLGYAVTQLFLEKGIKVGVLDLPGEENQEKVQGLGKEAMFLPGDITQSETVQQGLQQIQDQWEPIRIAVNCAGIGSAVKTLSKGKAYPLEIFQKTVEINLNGTFNVCRLAAEVMAPLDPLEEGERGIIVNTSSIAAYEGQMGQTAYAASKGGIVSMTLPMARDLSSYGIRVVTIAPGVFDTPLMGLLPEKARENLESQVPFPPRLGKPQEFALLVEQIVSNPMLNGTVIRLDGALRMGVK